MRKTFRQAAKYAVVGLGNTLLTMVVIYVMMKWLHCREGLSNITGYVAGLLNSFVWNKQWTFKESTTSWRKGVLRFALAFAVCYLLQWSLVTFLNGYLDIDHYYNHLIGMVFYTVLNFVLNKIYTFKD